MIIRFREDRRLKDLKQMNKVGHDNEKGFNWQKRLANMNLKKSATQKGLKPPKISRTRTKITPTQPSLVSKNTISETNSLRKMAESFKEPSSTAKKQTQIIGSSTNIDIRKQDQYLERIDRYKTLATKTQLPKDPLEKTIVRQHEVDNFWVETEHGKKFPVPVIFDIERSSSPTIDASKQDNKNHESRTEHSTFVKLIKERERQILSEWTLPEVTNKRFDKFKKSILLKPGYFDDKLRRDIQTSESGLTTEDDKLIQSPKESQSNVGPDSPDRMTRISLGNMHENSDTE